MGRLLGLKVSGNVGHTGQIGGRFRGFLLRCLPRSVPARVEGDGGVSGMVRGGVVRRAGWGRGWLGGRGVARRVKYFGHLAVIGAVEVLAEGGVSVLVFKGLLV